VAGFYQVLAFAPLLALELAPRSSVVLGACLLLSAAATGSMGALLALALGCGVALVLMAFVYRQWNALVGGAFGTALLLGVCAVAVLAAAHFDPALSARIDALFFERAERSAESRLALWESGLDLVAAGTPLFGIGPEQYHALEGRELHNDLIAFAVERGLLGVLALLVLMAAAARRSLAVARAGLARSKRWTLVFPAAVAAICAEAMTHEVFHMRQVWMLLALQEGVWWSSVGAPKRPPSSEA
jgi:hypothetical protein